MSDIEPSSIVAYIGIVLSGLTAIVGVINHKRIRSSCCGVKSEISIDIDNSSPHKIEKQQE